MLLHNPRVLQNERPAPTADTILQFLESLAINSRELEPLIIYGSEYLFHLLIPDEKGLYKVYTGETLVRVVKHAMEGMGVDIPPPAGSSKWDGVTRLKHSIDTREGGVDENGIEIRYVEEGEGI